MVGRPSNREEHYLRVMQALVRCVARYGLEGVSLNVLSIEAGMSRPSMRHHFGNRDEMLSILQDYVLSTFQSEIEAMLGTLPERNPASALVTFLFSDQGRSSPEMILAFAALTAKAAEDPKLRDACRAALLDFERTVTEVLSRQFPNVPAEACGHSAHGIAALYFNAMSLAPLEMPKQWLDTAHRLASGYVEQLEVP
ncbi:MAG: TetR/AcrR family transcriptional regulator [Acidobacteriota bacterium]